ncbi:ABC transporter substrate-binding protein [Saccharothrix violaceirubra]|uniref:Polar amino acid transport system substrate-binding protein n=1 Tax=Saccharothrix violaceirubra TaxID=413306 RepID=A0A7W7TAG2_9PSEU|nr:ABC transporter substrate-binding protein [Saccharothrix violaceirubra]MBB4969523.1 polar amino acid transport system substrate-binding protein [Saccharothrix violaceirubra]
MRAPLLIAAAALLAAACAPADEAGPPSQTLVNGLPCTKDKLATLTAGKITFGTDQPAYAPWFVDDDPSNGKGFESAIAYAVAGELGYAKEEVVWTRVPFNAAIQPGKKTYDADINQFSMTEERRQAVDFSASYYEVAQAAVTLKTGKAAGVKTLADLAQYKIGAQVGTTSFDAATRIVPSQQVAVYNTNDDAKAALTAGQIDVLLLDLPTALYVTSAELTDAAILGQVPGGQGRREHFGIVLDKNSPLTGCVSMALDTLRGKGKLKEIEQQWLAAQGTAPELK